MMTSLPMDSRVTLMRDLRSAHGKSSVMQLEVIAEDRELVRRMRAGEEAAFEAFAEHYIPALYRFAAASLGQDRELTREIVAATVCKAIEKLDSYRGEAALFTWLCACCRNEIAGHFRLQKGRPMVELDEAVVPAAGAPAGQLPTSPETLLLETESSALVHLTLDHLPPRYASALQWKYLDGLSVVEIAGRLALGMKAAESVLTRAREAFRGVYEELAGNKNGMER